ncbi:nickel pincer cofactor biosynthesis protein LarB [Streptomyces sp. NBC_01190]|uniref:nickel pincer cofactor biosynthesis protein LarB n=1 Tax=Streptomyces sp. NBC_01190 TaxID=2903767 RepID=UPI0038679A76|nr:nickel pincer cofactor biosynthesis protein LarB [Streptomyces sp. NBC_01190]
MDCDDVGALLRKVAAGTESPETALRALLAGPLTGRADPSGIEDLGFARLDTGRAPRTGDPEVIYGAGKTAAQTVALLRALARQPGHRSGVATRLPDETLAAVAEAFPRARIDPEARCAAVGGLLAPRGRVLVVSAGTSDEPVAREAAFVAREFGCSTGMVRDVGVAGIHRVLAVRDELDAADCLIVVAGMDGALPSVVAGLVGAPVVAVPTSVGYGASFGGVAALLAMLNSCGPGVVVCNIDNGFGAAVAAARMTRRPVRAAAEEPEPRVGP